MSDITVADNRYKCQTVPFSSLRKNDLYLNGDILCVKCQPFTVVDSSIDEWNAREIVGNIPNLVDDNHKVVPVNSITISITE